MSKRSNLIDLELNLHAETEKAIAVSDDGNLPYKWLPKSQIEYIEKGQSIIEVTLPEWLALDKGLI